MKLSKMLISSGALRSGRVRHCSDWEISSLAHGSRFGGSATLRAAAARRAQILTGGQREGVFSRLPALLGWYKRT